MKKKIILAGMGFLVLFLLIMVWYRATYSMDVLQPYEQGDEDAPKKVLIASQGSEFKNQLVQGVLTKTGIGSVYFRVIDVSKLSSVDPNQWNAIVIIHTWEMWKPEENSKEFLDQYYDNQKMIVVATSGAGDNKIVGVDGISCASELSKVNMTVEEVVTWLEKVLQD